MRSDPPQADELARAQSLRTGSFGLQLETSAAVVSALVDLDVHGMPQDSLDTFRHRVRAVTPVDTAAVAQELIHPERVAIVVVGPAEQIVPQLEDLGPVEVETP
jgi:zinc protease